MSKKRSFSATTDGESSDSQELSIELGKMKRVTVRKFKDMNLIDIREFYVDSKGDKKPGKKGISLTEELWFKLLESKDQIQQCLDNLSGNKRSKLDPETQKSGEAEKDNEVKNEDKNED